ncbi:RnfABCDGE type electron transport complex subunit E [Litorivicinus lipolyticus]|uniref:Ion-translocating oxidoreductase complex subunit E n=1 Tax=Litorivicinus lipolyticus TaxID=418701 RepID=A0A5Q2Q9G4_9GAMM|nr:electron transport complex subunit E [Litorivicinus lipolyticus]QGG79803.1 RnfABCDGE type electron transport complex subunit E [Litorivicinus lipolyticus]
MADTDYKALAWNGLWKNNPALVQLLGLCPLLAVSGTVINATGLGLATLFVLMGSNLAVSLIRHHVADHLRLPAFVMIIAAFTTCVELLMQAYAYSLYQVLGLFIPLIVTNCAILGRADGFARKNSPLPALLDGLWMGLGFMAVLVLLGAIRELIGQGTLLDGAQLLFGEGARHWRMEVAPDNYPGVLIAILPPGAFILLGFMIAAKQAWDIRVRRLATTEVVAGSKRVRVTGEIAK